MKVNGGYDWFKYTSTKPDGCSVTNYYDSKVYDIINNNRYNQYPKVYSCNQCKCVNALTGSYIAFVEEDEFCQILKSILTMPMIKVKRMQKDIT